MTLKYNPLLPVGLDDTGSGGGSSLTVKDQDGTPTVSNVTTIKVTNGKLTDDGSGTVSLDLSGSAGTVVVNPGVISMTGVKYVSGYLGGLASGDNVLYTAPAGKRAIINAFNVYNDTAGSINFYPFLRISGTNYKYSGTLACSANSPNGVATAVNIILEPGEGFGINVASTGMNAWARIIEYDNTVPIYAAKKVGSWASGDNTIYTVPTATNAVLIDGVGTIVQNVTSMNYYNSSGGARTVRWFSVPSGGSTGATTRVSASSSIGNDTRSSLIVSHTMATGHSIVLNTNATTDTQVAWVMVMELPN